MKSTFLIIFSLIISTLSFGQDSYSKRIPITDHLRSTSSGGRVQIFQDPRLDSLMYKQSNPEIVSPDQEEMFVTGRGYRIQIFSGNNQRESKTEAYAKEKEINTLFTNLDTYVTFQSPFWKLRVGNFRTSEEAHAMLRELKKSFPRWKEMFIVPDVIKFPINPAYSPN